MFHLIIKGTKQEAIDAANNHGIELTNVSEHPTHNETHASAIECHWHGTYIPHWFAEPPHKAPYPIGALLWWGESNSANVAPCILETRYRD